MLVLAITSCVLMAGGHNISKPLVSQLQNKQTKKS